MLCAAPRDYAGKPIAEIRFDPAQQPLEEEELQRLVALTPGEPLSLDELSQAIERLYATGRYEDIAIDAQLARNGVVLTFQTKQAWFVGGVDVGNVPEPPNKGQLVTATKLELGEEYTPEDLEQAIQNVQDTLRANGFYKATVRPEFSRASGTQQIRIRLKIEPGERAKFTEPVITGQPERTPEQLINSTNWERWWGLLGYKPVTERGVQQGLQRVRDSYQKRDHLMAKVTLEKMDYLPDTNRVKPVLNVVAGPKVEIRTAGAKVSRGRLRQLIPVYQERAVDRDLLVEGIRSLTQYFQTQGYFDAEVQLEDPKDVDPNHQVIEYSIERGNRHKLVYVEVQGNRYFDDQTIRERMAITPASLIRYRYGRYSEDLLERDVEAIRGLYQANGFPDVKVTTKTIDDYQGKARDIAVFMEIEEGPQWFVANLELVGVNLRDYEYVQTLLQSIAGQPYSEVNVATDRDTILNYYYNNGFPDATFDYTVNPGSDPNTVNLRFVVTEGRRIFVRDVLVSGLEATDPGLVRDRISLEATDPLSQSQMVDSQRRLYDLGIFARVDMAIQNPEGRERNKYVLYQLEEASKYSIKGSIGAQIARIGGSSTTDLDAPAGTAGFSPRISFGASRTNFLGVGHTVSFDGRLSTLQRRGLLTYLAPQFKGDEDLNLSFNALYEDSRDVRTFTAQRLEGSVQLGQRLTRANTAQYRFSYRRVRVDEATLKITPQLIPLLSQPVRIGALSGSFIQDRRDDPIDPRRGIYNTIDLGVASSVFGGQTDFLRLLFRNSTYHRLTREIVLARTVTLGGIRPFNNDDPSKDVPLPERFFGGGATSHRGFPDNQAGPRDLTTGFPIGGKAVLTHGLELRFPLIGDNVGGVLFHDVGNVYSSLNKISFRFSQRDLTDFDYAVHAIGFGFRYRTPVGPIRLDLAYGVNSPRFIGFKGTREELLFGGGVITEQRINRFQFHFSLGQAF